MTAVQRRSYDHRLRLAVAASGDTGLFRDLDIIATFVEDHNVVIPRAALGGRTPDDVFLGREEDLPERLAVARRRACADRIQVNQARASCGGCDGPGHPTPRGEVVDG